MTRSPSLSGGWSRRRRSHWLGRSRWMLVTRASVATVESTIPASRHDRSCMLVSLFTSRCCMTHSRHCSFGRQIEERHDQRLGAADRSGGHGPESAGRRHQGHHHAARSREDWHAGSVGEPLATARSRTAGWIHRVSVSFSSSTPSVEHSLILPILLPVLPGLSPQTSLSSSRPSRCSATSRSDRTTRLTFSLPSSQWSDALAPSLRRLAGRPGWLSRQLVGDMIMQCPAIMPSPRGWDSLATSRQPHQSHCSIEC